MAASNSAEVVIVGASIAWRLAQAGLHVALVIGEREAAASRVAAGMLAPVSETTFTEQPLLRLNLASADLFPDFVSGVEEAAEATAGLRRAPTLSVAYDADDAARLNAFADFLERSGLPCQRAAAGTGRSGRATG